MPLGTDTDSRSLTAMNRLRVRAPRVAWIDVFACAVTPWRNFTSILSGAYLACDVETEKRVGTCWPKTVEASRVQSATVLITARNTRRSDIWMA